PEARAIGLDLSHAALCVAQRNAEKNRVSKRLELRESDLFSALNSGESFDLIVSNPPYVSAEEMEGLSRELRHEPVQALLAGPDGLSVIKRLINESPPFLKRGGHLVFEIGFGQSERVKELIKPNFWTLVSILNDLQGIPRSVVLRKR